MSDPPFSTHQLVYCAHCYLPYDTRVNITRQVIPSDAANRSWYLTSCAHALCSQCLFPEGVPASLQEMFECPKCKGPTSVVGLAPELPTEILPYFRSITDASEEILGAIKYQHQSLLHLVAYLQCRIDRLTSLVQSAQEELEKRRDEQTELERLRQEVKELRTRMGDTQLMPPPAAPNKGATHTIALPPATPANFRTSLASRQIQTPFLGKSPSNTTPRSSGFAAHVPSLPKTPQEVPQMYPTPQSHQYEERPFFTPSQTYPSTPSRHHFNPQVEPIQRQIYTSPRPGPYPIDFRNRSITTPLPRSSRSRDPPIPLGPRSPVNMRSYTGGRGALVSASVRAGSSGRGISPLRGRTGSGSFVEGLTAHGGKR